MKLVSFTIRNYRSIINAKKINVGKKTILVGPNNEGKSNILRALATAMKVLTRKGVMSDFPGENMRYFYEEKPYRWETDFPISLQSTQPKGATEIVLEFQPTADELIELQETIGSEPTGNIPLRIRMDQNDFTVTYHKKGGGSAVLSKKSDQIAQFITGALDFEQIEAVRTAESAADIVTSMVIRDLDKLEKNAEYVKLTKAMEELQKPVLNALSNSIENTLKQFLPDIRSVEIELSQRARLRAIRRECDILVDDGTKTSLKR